MHLPKTRPQALPIEVEVAQLRAQVQVLAELLIECGIVDESMVQGRLRGAASRARPSYEAGKKPGWFARLFRKREVSEVRMAPRLADETMPVMELPFEVSALYGESDGSTRRRNLTPTTTGKCQRCWRVRPLAADRLCFRCSR